jgi:hypothetical protein
MQGCVRQKKLVEVRLKVAMEVLSILAFLLGSPLYLGRPAKPLQQNHPLGANLPGSEKQ